MFLQIADNMTIEDVEDRFTECFPFLKIAFFSKAHRRFEPSDKRYMYNEKKKIGDIRKNHYNGFLEIKSWHTTCMVEKEINTMFGLNAQVFHWDGTNHCWVQTSLTDGLTLEQLSQLASEPT